MSLLLENIAAAARNVLLANAAFLALDVPVLLSDQNEVEKWEELPDEAARALRDFGFVLYVETPTAGKLPSEDDGGAQDVLVSLALFENPGVNRAAEGRRIPVLKVVRLVQAALLGKPEAEAATSQETFRLGETPWERRDVKHEAPLHRINFEIRTHI